MEVCIIIAAVLVIFFVKGIIDKDSYAKKLQKKITKSYGEVPDKTYTEEKKKSLKYYFDKKGKTDNYVDDITWNDLGMNQIFMTMNACDCNIGEEYLYSILRTPVTDPAILEERKRIIDYFAANPETRNKFRLLFKQIGMMRNISVYEYLNRLKEVNSDNTGKHVSQALILIGTIVAIFFDPVIGIVSTLIAMGVNMVSYFNRKKEIENYFAIVSYIIRIINEVRELKKIDCPELKEYVDKAVKASDKFNGMRFGAGIVVSSNQGSGDLLQSFLDYIRMAFHIDLIKFNRMISSFRNHSNEFNTMFETIGLLDSMCAVASFRELMGFWCEPKLEICTDKKPYYRAEGLYHPMLDEPVPSSFKANKSCLITGSNASGKSTFIKTVAINSILAQSIYTCMAKSFEASYFKIMSSMALQDSISDGESYYIVEIKSLKRILDARGEVPVLCFIDEVLRGTNTLERIAASSQILKTLGGENSLCFAATHDIELTFILEKLFDNYHFEEQINGKEVIFDYQLHEGRAVSRNAIKLLGMLGYSNEIINMATDMANSYLENGEWKCLN